MQLIVTIPAKDERENIAQVIREVPRDIPGISSVRVLVIDDGSEDGTAEVARAAGADWVFRNRRNMGLAFSFQRALAEAVALGADVVVNTDGDNHYNQSAIPYLIEPIVEGRADMVIGSRELEDVHMPAANRHGNRIANAIMQRLLGLPGVDVSTGFRAYSREAALRFIVYSRHTYTHESLLGALEQQMVIVNRPVAARTVNRPSRLISSVPRHIYRAGLTILRSFLLYRPLEISLLVGVMFVALSGLLGLRFVVYWLQDGGQGHVQSLLLALGLLYTGGQVILLGLLADAVRANRRLMQETLRNTRDLITRAPHPASEQPLAPRAHRVSTPALSTNGVSKHPAMEGEHAAAIE